MKTILFLATLLLSTHALADEASKRAKITALAKVQGLEQMFQQQLDQSKASIAALGNDIFEKTMKENGAAASPDDPKAKEILKRYMERAALIYTAKEYADTWSRSYGKDLSEADLDKMLAYYRSPLGQRDVRATQAAMINFSEVVAKESQARLGALIEEMIKDLKATLPQ
jgi:hypothetical protein